MAAAIVAAVAVTWAGVPGIRQSTPPPATADTVLARVQHALASLDSISGDVVEYGSARGRPYSHRVGSFIFTSRGDYRIVQGSEDVTYTYDAVKRVARRYVFRDGKALYSEVARDLPDPGPFFGPWMGSSQVLDSSVAAYARAVIAELDPDVPVTPVTWEGRTAWSITVPEPLAGGGSDGTARIVVDAQSGLPAGCGTLDQRRRGERHAHRERARRRRRAAQPVRARRGRPGQAAADERALPPR